MWLVSLQHVCRVSHVACCGHMRVVLCAAVADGVSKFYVLVHTPVDPVLLLSIALFLL